MLPPLGKASNSINYRTGSEERSQFPINKVFSGNHQEIKGKDELSANPRAAGISCRVNAAVNEAASDDQT